MPRPRFHKLDPAERDRILDGAAREFADHGFVRASLNRIIRATGLSKGAMYYYFDSKEDLFEAVVDHALVIYRHFGAAPDLMAVDRDRYWSQLDEFVEAHLRFAEAHPWVVGLSRALLSRLDAPGPGQRIVKGFRWFTERYLERGQELGLVRTDLPMGLMVDAVMGLGEAIDRWVLEHWDDADVERLSPIWSDLFRRLVAPAGETTVEPGTGARGPDEATGASPAQRTPAEQDSGDGPEGES